MTPKEKALVEAARKYFEARDWAVRTGDDAHRCWLIAFNTDPITEPHARWREASRVHRAAVSAEADALLALGEAAHALGGGDV